MSDCALSHSDAAYVLGSLSPADRLEFERHLPGCESCRRSVAELAGLPGLLGRVPVEHVEAPAPVEPPPATVLPALVSVVRREQRRQNVLITLGAAAAIVAVALGVNALQGARDDGETPSATQSITSSSVPAPVSLDAVGTDWGMRVDVTLTPARGGTRVDVMCSYAERDSDYSGHAYRYKLVVFSRGHDPEVASNWKAKAGDSMTVWGATAADVEEITRLEVQNEEGKVLLAKEL